MPTSLYDLSVANYLQTIPAMSGVLEKGLAHCKEKGIDLGSIVVTKLADDMLPFSFQIVAVAHHAVGTIEALKSGQFGPPRPPESLDYAALQKLLSDAEAALRKLTRSEVEALAGRDVAFKLRGQAIPFTAENFVLSFSLPNFYFHATTAYDILRTKGVPLGKRDFLGSIRIKT